MKFRKLAALSVLLGLIIIGAMYSDSRKAHAAGPVCAVPGDYPTISAAVADAACSTINVAAGTYTENVAIGRSVILNGAQMGVDARGRAASETIVMPLVAANPTFNIAFNGALTINGFSLSGGTALGQIMTGSAGPNDNMQILNNRFSGYSGSAIFMNRGGANITIDKNVMDGSNIASSGQAIFASNTQSYLGLQITNNWIINNTGRYGIFSDGNHNVRESATRIALIKGNLINNNNQGMNLGSRSFGSTTVPVLGAYTGEISENVVTNNVFDGIQGGVQYVLVTKNTIKNNGRNGIGLSNIGSAGSDRGAQHSSVTCNLVTNNGVAMAGAGISLSAAPVGTQATNVINSNNITGNATGFRYLGAEVINAENNFWGSATGPTIISNPGGTGDSIDNPSGSVDYFPFLTTFSPCAPAPDSDGDGVADNVDNCPSTPNPGQEDADLDGVGDLCDNCPMQINPDQTDADNDGIGDICDACPADPANDADGDGVCGNVDNCPTAFNPDQSDIDNDTIGDACDTDLNPYRTKEKARNDLVALRSMVTDKEDGKKLDEAIKHLNKSLDLDLWIDDYHPKPKGGEKVFNEEKDAVNKLRELMKDKHSTIPDATLLGFIDRIRKADRRLAEVAINDHSSGDPKKIAKANEELSKGDADFADGKPDNAIEHYRNAWDQALKA